MQTPVKILIAVLAVLVVGCGGVLGWAYNTYKNVSTDPSIAFEQPSSTADTVQVTNSDGTIDTVKRNTNTYNVLLMGIDSNSEREAESKVKRSDMLMLCTINFDNNSVHLTSIPRDSYAQLYKLDAEGNVTNSYYGKITNAYSIGGRDVGHGAENSMRCVSELLSCEGKLSVPIDMYFAIDMDGITELCDVLGGVEVTLTEDLPHMTEKGGNPTGTYIGRKGDTVTLYGDDAETFVRMRHAYAGGDFTRAKHQQQFMIAIAKKIKDLGAVSAVTSMFPKLIEFAETNITLDQALALAQILNDIEIDDIQYQTLEGKSANKNGSSVVLLDEEFMYNYMLEIMYGFNSGTENSAAEETASAES